MVSEIERRYISSNPCGIQTHCWGLIYNAAKMLQYDGAEGGKMRSVHLCVWGEWGERGGGERRARKTNAWLWRGKMVCICNPKIVNCLQMQMQVAAANSRVWWVVVNLPRGCQISITTLGFGDTHFWHFPIWASWRSEMGAHFPAVTRGIYDLQQYFLNIFSRV